MDKASGLAYETQNLACIWILAFVSDDGLKLKNKTETVQFIIISSFDIH